MKNEYGILPDGNYFIIISDRYGDQYPVTVDAEGLKVAIEFKGNFYPFKHPRTGKIYARGYYNNPATKRVEQPLLHRLIMNPQRGENTAHINGDTLDCTRKNMRNVEIGIDIKSLVEKERQAAQEEGRVDRYGNIVKPIWPDHVEVNVEVRPLDPWDQEEAETPPTLEPLKGVSLHKVKQRWEVSPFYEGKRYRLGYWDKDDLESANAAVSFFREVGPDEYFKKYPKGGKT